MPTDKTGKEFKKQRSLMYTYEVYNPYTGKEEIIDLSKAINVDIPVSDKVKDEIIEPCEENRKKAKEELYALIPDKETEIMAANLAEILKREKMAQWLAQSQNSDAEAILDKVWFAQPVKLTKRNFIAKRIKMAMNNLPVTERALRYAAVIGAFAITTGATYFAYDFARDNEVKLDRDSWEMTVGQRNGMESLVAMKDRSDDAVAFSDGQELHGSFELTEDKNEYTYEVEEKSPEQLEVAVASRDKYGKVEAVVVTNPKYLGSRQKKVNKTNNAKSKTFRYKMLTDKEH